MDRQDRLQAAKDHVAAKITDAVLRHLDDDLTAFEKAGAFTALLEAYRALEIAELADVGTSAERAQDAEDYRQGVLRNQE